MSVPSLKNCSIKKWQVEQKKFPTPISVLPEINRFATEKVRKLVIFGNIIRSAAALTSKIAINFPKITPWLPKIATISLTKRSNRARTTTRDSKSDNDRRKKLSITLASLTKSKAVLPPRVQFYGPPGVGKTTLAASFPKPVFIQIEDGTPGGLSIDTFGVLETYEQVSEALKALLMEEHDFKTVVLDTVDSFEPLVWDKTNRANGWTSIEEPGFGKGYAAADEFWSKFLRGLDAVRRTKLMNVVLLGHSDVQKFDPPGMESYSRYSLRVHKRGANLIADEMDVLGFINFRTDIKSEDAGFGKTKSHAVGGGQRWLHVEHRPAYEAKNRYGLTPEAPIIKDTLPQTWADAGVPVAGINA